MIDYIKLWHDHPDAEYIKSLGFLDFTMSVSKDGEVLSYVAKYRNLDIKLTSNNKLEVKGSIHTFCKGFNDGDFNYCDLARTVKELCDLLKVRPEDCRIRSFEFGVNFRPPIPSKKFLDSICLYMNKHIDKETFNGKGYLLRYENSRFYLKIYDKGRHAKKGYRLIRYEMGVKKMEVVKQYGIYYLSDLLDRKKLFGLLGMLTKHVDHFLITNPYLDAKMLPTVQRRFVNKYATRSIWEQLSSKDISRLKERYKAILLSAETPVLQEEFKSIIKAKWEDLLSS